ncbi:MAG: phage regulatory CII family protein [Nitrosomonas sp.]|nr:MAG: phage regulatory CII family protein [Nitrosomonas sp.]
MDLFDTIHEVAHSYPGGVEALAGRMGKNPGTLRKKLLPNEVTHELTVRELRTIVDYVDTDKIARAFAADRGLMCISMPDYEGLSDKEILDLFLDLQAQQGAWANEIREAMQNGEIDWNELMSIRKEYNKFIAAAAEVMNRLESFMGVTEEMNSKRTQK